MPEGSRSHVCALVHEAKEGNRGALGSLLTEIRPWIWEAAAKRTPRSLWNWLDPSDLAQEACLHVVAQFQGFRGDTEEELYTWLGKIVHHVVYDAIRRLRAAKRDCRRNVSLQE